jgi:hypothetical protein
MGMGEFLYPQAGVGMGVGKILSGGYGCGWAIPNGFVPIAISTEDFWKRPWKVVLSGQPTVCLGLPCKV